MPGEFDVREHDVTDECAALACDQRSNRLRLSTQQVDKVGFGRAVECGRVERVHRVPVVFVFESYLHAVLAA